jgi:transposase
MDRKIQALTNTPATPTQNSTNSSKPPSSDGPEVTRKKSTPTGRKAGAQDGHEGKHRELLPAGQMDYVFDRYPYRCEKCSLHLNPDSAKQTSDPIRHQTFEVEIKPVKTEIRYHEIECICGHRTRAPMPPEEVQSCFGPKAHAVIAYLTSSHLGTRRGVGEIMSTLFGIDISLGSICNILERVSSEMKSVVDEIKQALPGVHALNADETSWKSKAERRTLWVFVSPLFVYFCIAAGRGANVLRSVLGAVFSGIITSDDHSAYRAYHKEGLRQLCWAHLIRKFKALLDIRGSPDAQRFATVMLKEIESLFTCWHAFVENAITRRQLRQTTALIRGRMKSYCQKYLSSEDAAVRTRCEQMIKNWEHLFTFIFHEGVEPTNNIAERSLRPAVQWRKICFGSQSDNGERFTERVLTVTRTCRLQGRNPFHFLCDLMNAAFNNTTCPTLV